VQPQQGPGAEPLMQMGDGAELPEKFRKIEIDLVPLRAILAIERTTIYRCQTPAEGAPAGVWGAASAGTEPWRLGAEPLEIFEK